LSRTMASVDMALLGVRVGAPYPVVVRPCRHDETPVSGLRPWSAIV
jgi:hypothetical protein